MAFSIQAVPSVGVINYFGVSGASSSCVVMGDAGVRSALLAGMESLGVLSVGNHMSGVNPHGTDAEQVGTYTSGQIDIMVASAATFLRDEVSAVASAVWNVSVDLSAHLVDFDNPHNTDASQLGVYTSAEMDELLSMYTTTGAFVEIAADLSAGISGHVADVYNPHRTSAFQVGSYTSGEVNELIVSAASAALRIDQTIPQSVVNGLPAFVAGAKFGTATDDGAGTPIQVFAAEYTCPNPTGLRSSATYPSTFSDVYDNGSTIDFSAGSFINTGAEFYIYGTDGSVYSYSYVHYSNGDGSDTPFQFILNWALAGPSATGYVIQAYDSDYNPRYIILGDVTTLTVPDWSGWQDGYANTSPNAIATGSLTDYYSWLVYAYKTTDGVKVFSSVPTQTSDYDQTGTYVGYKTTLGWDDVGADGYILVNETAGCWIDVGNTLSKEDDGLFVGWTAGVPTVTPTPYSKDMFHGSSANYDFKIKGNGQIVNNVPVGVKPFNIQSTTLNNNLNADLLDGQHATYFQPAVIGYTALSAGGSRVISPNLSYTWTTSGASTLGVTGFTSGKDQSSSIILTMAAGSTLTGSGVTIVDAPTVGKVSHCFVRSMPNGVVKFFVSYEEP